MMSNWELVIWLELIGVSLHAWCDDFLKLVFSYHGQHLKVDSYTNNKLRLDYARVMMSIACIEDLNDVVNVLVDGVTHGIKFIEETRWRFGGNITCKDDTSNCDSCKSEATKCSSVNDSDDVVDG
jgi:hypothetical protein